MLQAVVTLLAVPAAKGLFRQAISESPAAGMARSQEVAARFADRFAAADSAPGRADAAHALMYASPAILVTALDSLIERTAAEMLGAFPVGPSFGDDVLPLAPMEAMRTGQAHPVPLIVGTNADEARLFTRFLTLLPTSEHKIEALLAGAGAAMRDRIIEAYPDYPARSACIRIGGDFVFASAAWQVADAHATVAPTYVYRYDYAPRPLHWVGDGRHPRHRIVRGVRPLQLRFRCRADSGRGSQVRSAGQPGCAVALAGVRAHRSARRRLAGLHAHRAPGDGVRPPLPAGIRPASTPPQRLEWVLAVAPDALKARNPPSVRSLRTEDMAMTKAADSRTDHPLDPLTAEEFSAVAALLRRDRGVDPGGGGWRITAIEMVEPDKAELLDFEAGGARPARKALALCLDRRNNATYRSMLSLTDDSVESFEHVPGVQANFTVDEFEECDRVLRSHPDVVAALARRGITDVDLVFMDTWTYGDAVAPPEYRDRRIGWSDTWVRNAPGANPYANPISGLHCVIDLNSMELLRIEDSGPFSEDTARPVVMGEYVPKHIPERIRASWRREPLKPLEITQSGGPSFVLEGNLLRWQNWSLRVGFNHREGMTLHTVRYRDGDRERSIAHRMSFAEMMVPYRDSSEDHYRRTAFDIGEWGLGFMTTSLELGCDCLGEIRYLDATLHNSKGEPYAIPNAVCIHEEDNAVLWKHVDHDAGAEVRRMRRLTVSCHVTVANYEYLVYWRFYQDGNIECEVRATGIMVTTPIRAGRRAPQRHAGRRPHVCPVPPALFDCPTRSRRRRD